MIMSDINFTITEEHLGTGMRGYPVGYCVTSSVSPTRGLFYCGIPVDDLAKQRPESVIYLLYHGHEGNPNEVEEFSASLQERAFLSEKTIESIRNLPREGHPMKLFSAALLIAGMFEGTKDWKEDCLNLIAKIPLITAHVVTHHAGWEGPNLSRPEEGYMENFSQMLNVPDADEKRLEEVFKIFNVLHYDHGGGNLSCFVGKACASGHEDMYGSITAAMCALAGPKHGKANQDCLQFVKEVLAEVGEDATAKDVERLIRRRMEKDQLVFGFGHAVLRVEDPRASVFYAIAEQHFSDHPLVKIAAHLRTEGPKVLKEYPKIQNPYPNVDAISGTVLSAAGFAYPEYFTVLFGMARSVGIAIQILYERTEVREGKGAPIVRPKYLYKER